MNSNDMDHPAVTHISLCSGYGGIDLGLRRCVAGLRTIAYSEIEAFACELLLARMESGQLDAAPIWTDLKRFPWDQFRDRVGILSGGYPCQPFSAAGKRLGKDDPRHLWPFIADGIGRMRPSVCFFENVEGHISLGLSTVVSDLGELGYKVSWGIFSAAEVGAPHGRKRVFILAHRKGEGLERYDQLFAGCRQPRWQSSEQAGQIIGSNRSGKTMADAASGRSKGLPDGNAESAYAFPCGPWPSRPGQPQHGWEPPRVVGLENAASKRSRSQGGNAVYQGRTSSEAGSASISQDTQRQAGSAIADHQSTSGNGEPPRVVGNTKSQRSPTFRTEHEGQRGELCASCTSGQGVVGNPSQLQRNGGDDNSGNSQRSEEISESGNASWQGVGNSAKYGRRYLSERNSAFGLEQPSGRQTEPSLGRDTYGSAGGLDYAQLCVSGDNRVDELRLLGNGVVPATAERAFRILTAELLA